MGIDFTWHSGNAEPALPSAPPARRPPVGWRRRLPAIVLVLALAGALVAWRAWQGEEAARADLQRVVEREVAALAAGQREDFLSLLARRTPYYWYNYHDSSFHQESAWFAARATARVRVERVRLGTDRATVAVALDDGRETRRGTWYYQRIDGEWRHAAPPEQALEERHTASTGCVTVTAQGLGEAETARLAADLDALYEELVQRYGLALEASPAPMGGTDESPSPLRIEVEVTPTHSHPATNRSVAGGHTQLWIAVPSPQLALELRTPEERSAALQRSVRLALASELLYRGGQYCVLGQVLALWHARAWEPEWEACARTAVADGTWRRYLDLWCDPERMEDGEWWRDVLGRYEGVAEEAMLKALGDWVGAMHYNLGGFLVTAYPSERLGGLLQTGDRTSGELEVELGVTRDELEAEWGAFLRERYGSSGAPDERR